MAPGQNKSEKYKQEGNQKNIQTLRNYKSEARAGTDDERRDPKVIAKRQNYSENPRSPITE